MNAVFDLQLFLEATITLIVIMDPPGTVPVFLSLVGRKPQPARACAARQAVLVSLVVVALFAVAGQAILAYLGIGIPALQGAGGLLLLLIALELLTGRGNGEPETADDVNVRWCRWVRRCLPGPVRSRRPSCSSGKRTDMSGRTWRWVRPLPRYTWCCGCACGIPERSSN